MSKIKSRQGNATNPFRLLLHVPVPWIFVLTYLIGVVLQFVFPFNVPPEALFFCKIVGIVLFITGVVFESWCLLIFRKANTIKFTTRWAFFIYSTKNRHLYRATCLTPM